MKYHRPVMLQQCIQALDIKPGGTYVDLTFGGGGHSSEILSHLSGGRLFAFDQDSDTKANATPLIQQGMVIIESNFRYVQKYLKMYQVDQVDGILADLGVSSYQIDTPQRGFSTRSDALLDMRMDQKSSKNARLVINDYSEESLVNVLSKFGEVRNSRTLAHNIVSSRRINPIKTINDFKQILLKTVPHGRENKYLAQVFQAFRIEVNDELLALEEMLKQGMTLLKKKGRFVVMSYHSLEDRLVKNFFTKGKFSGEVEKDFYGNVIRPLTPVNKKPIIASNEEVAENKRSRSAKLRIAEKL